jgi:hypothetical protein
MHFFARFILGAFLALSVYTLVHWAVLQLLDRYRQRRAAKARGGAPLPDPAGDDRREAVRGRVQEQVTRTSREAYVRKATLRHKQLVDAAAQAGMRRDPRDGNNLKEPRVLELPRPPSLRELEYVGIHRCRERKKKKKKKKKKNFAF